MFQLNVPRIVVCHYDTPLTVALTLTSSASDGVHGTCLKAAGDKLENAVGALDTLFDSIREM